LVTILKAFYDTDKEWKEVGRNVSYCDELNKLATNVSYGRNTAGVHYAEDGHAGLLLGEAVAIEHLKVLISLNPCKSNECPLEFKGFEGNTIKVYPVSSRDLCFDNFCTQFLVTIMYVVFVLFIFLIIFGIAYYCIKNNSCNK